jgi:hypothetical protein
MGWLLKNVQGKILGPESRPCEIVRFLNSGAERLLAPFRDPVHATPRLIAMDEEMVYSHGPPSV